jgi:hypothetical protein
MERSYRETDDKAPVWIERYTNLFCKDRDITLNVFNVSRCDGKIFHIEILGITAWKNASVMRQMSPRTRQMVRDRLKI